jgi:hypothetical protein
MKWKGPRSWSPRKIVRLKHALCLQSRQSSCVQHLGHSDCDPDRKSSVRCSHWLDLPRACVTPHLQDCHAGRQLHHHLHTNILLGRWSRMIVNKIFLTKEACQIMPSVKLLRCVGQQYRLHCWGCFIYGGEYRLGELADIHYAKVVEI